MSVCFLLFYYLLQRQKTLTIIENDNQFLWLSQDPSSKIFQIYSSGTFSTTHVEVLRTFLFHLVSCLYPVCQNDFYRVNHFLCKNLDWLPWFINKITLCHGLFNLPALCHTLLSPLQPYWPFHTSYLLDFLFLQLVDNLCLFHIVFLSYFTQWTSVHVCLSLRMTFSRGLSTSDPIVLDCPRMFFSFEDYHSCSFTFMCVIIWLISISPTRL